MVSFRSAIAFASLSSVAFAQLDLGGLVQLDLPVSILTGGNLINVNAVANLLSTAGCPANQVVGLVVSLPPLLSVCACVDALDLGTPVSGPCGPCPANAVPVCGGGTCACACKADFFAGQNGVCVPRTACLGNVIGDLVDGTSVCICADGFLANLIGGCTAVVGPSQMAGRRTKKSVVLNLCPANESACPLPSGGFECLDVTSSLDSCGGCLGEGGVNCLSIPGALGVSCAASVCEISSCFPGWTYKSGACIRA